MENKPKPKPKPKSPSLGSGMAEKARKTIRDRKSYIDKILDQSGA